jgi:hypothetical protein
MANDLAFSGGPQRRPLQRVVSHRLATLVPVQSTEELPGCPKQWGQIAKPVAARDENDHPE